MENSSRLIKIFQEETLERMDSVEAGLLQLEKQQNENCEDLINSIFRDAHSVKAGSNLLELHKIEELSHKLENVLELMRSEGLVANDDIITACLEAVDKLRMLTENINENKDVSIRLQIAMLDLSVKRAQNS